MGEVNEMTPILRRPLRNSPIQLPIIDEEQMTEDMSPPTAISNENVSTEMLGQSSAVSQRQRSSEMLRPSPTASQPLQTSTSRQAWQSVVPPGTEINTESSFFDEY